jgi:osmotically inducible protein OsmC
MLPKKSCYQTRATAVGGRIGGAASADGRLRVRLDDPADGSGKGTNPEQLFAAAYAACFLSAIRKVADGQGIVVAPDANVTADVVLGDGEGAAALGITLSVDLAGLDEGTAERLAAAAHDLCPYSKAIRGDAQVDIRIA